MTRLDPATLRALAREFDNIADSIGAGPDDRETYLAGYVAMVAAAYRTRAIKIEQAWRADTAELPIVRGAGDGTRAAG